MIRDTALKVIPNFCLSALTGMKMDQELNLVSMGGDESSDLEHDLAVPEAKCTCHASQGGHGGGRWGDGGS